MSNKFFTAWEVHTKTIGALLEEALGSGEVKATDTVWQGPDGSYAVAETGADLEEEHTEYTDSGTVAEYLENREAA